MLIAINRGVGGNFCFPDVCNTPAGPAVVPIPYPNFAFVVMAVPFCIIVRYSYVNAVNMGSMIPMTTGDEPGVAHPFFKQMGRFTIGNPKVFIEKLPAIHLTIMCSGNNMNAPVGAVLIPSVTNVFIADREANVDEDAKRRDVVHAEMLDGAVGYVRVPVLTKTTPNRFARSLDRLVEEGATAVVLDLRGNPGGELEAARRLAEELLPRDADIALIREDDGDETMLRSRHDGRTDLPLTILVDEMTASAAEVLAASLQWHGRATVVGAPTYGKGRGQAALELPDERLVDNAFTCSLPDGAPIEGRGVIPDRPAATR